jgi:secretion/DNA translocation related TadE-like protein
VLRAHRSESGQITVLVLAVALALLAATCLIGGLAQAMVTHQRLNTKADSIALAAAQELELNQVNACNVAREFSAINFGLDANCIVQSDGIEILLSEPNPNTFLSKFLPNIYATSRAGIAANNSPNNLDLNYFSEG